MLSHDSSRSWRSAHAQHAHRSAGESLCTGAVPPGGSNQLLLERSLEGTKQIAQKQAHS
jgi:hypothetical protein